MEQNRWKQAARALTLCAAAALAACTQAGENPPAESAQIVSGRVARHNFASEVIGVRAVSGDTAAVWSAVALDGSFSLELPAGAEYRMEVVTAAGSHGLVASADGRARALSFAVCSAGTPFDVGHVHSWAQSGDEKPGDDCGDPPPPCDENGSCCFPDGTCCLADGSCCSPGGTCCAPGQPCEPPPCEPGPDGNCDPQPPSPCEAGPDGNCDQPTQPCDDYDDPSCWPQPGTPPCAGQPDADSGAACWSDGAVPEKLIPDFGCG